jgi:HAD superfamily hydrolase (TIGR01549 family)
MQKNTIYTLSGCTFTCLLFDFGNTLWYGDASIWDEVEHAANQQAARILRRFIGSTVYADHADSSLGALFRETVMTCIRRETTKNPAIEPELSVVMRQAFAELGLPAGNNALYEALFEALRMRIYQSRRLFPDVLATLHELQKRAFQLGVVTNRYWGGEPFQEDVQLMGLLDYFEPEKIIVSADTRLRKPNPEIFARALTACNVESNKTIMVGDSLSADVAGAQQLHIFAVWKPVHYNDVRQYLATSEGISIAEYNERQMTILRERGMVEAPVLPDPPAWKKSGLDHFIDGSIRPQLIINDLKELLDWL